MGGSRYVLIPKALREQLDIEIGDEIIFLRSAEFPETVIRIEKQTPKNGSEHPA
jgi:bifunctional DNA-binding transcriptional regulator/antitoxin component of YhaV-PrlF toxin-antitoxin module